jgi:demethoxyubiquinone hydroxylase (CLK1/Coq7/Cat5 family)
MVFDKNLARIGLLLKNMFSFGAGKSKFFILISQKKSMNFSNEIEDPIAEVWKKQLDQMTHRSGSDSATFFRVDWKSAKNILRVQHIAIHIL